IFLKTAELECLSLSKIFHRVFDPKTMRLGHSRRLRSWLAMLRRKLADPGGPTFQGERDTHTLSRQKLTSSSVLQHEFIPGIHFTTFHSRQLDKEPWPLSVPSSRTTPIRLNKTRTFTLKLLRSF